MNFKLTTSFNKSLSCNEYFLKLILKSFGIPHLGTRIRFNLISQVLRSYNACCILDAGCGYGFSSLMLSQKGLKVLGVDDDYNRIKLAKKLARHSSVKFIKANLYSLPFKDQSFDTTLCLEVLEHLKNDLTAIKELKRVTKQSGKIIISFPEAKANIVGYEDFGHLRPGYSVEEFLDISKKLGLKIDQFIPYGQSLLGKAALQIDYNLSRTSLFLSSFAFPILYPLIIIDQSLPSKNPWNYIVVLSK